MWRALASGKLKLASRSGEMGSMVDLQRRGRLRGLPLAKPWCPQAALQPPTNEWIPP